jgi:predicted Na+-dependent transporter
LELNAVQLSLVYVSCVSLLAGIDFVLPERPGLRHVDLPVPKGLWARVLLANIVLIPGLLIPVVYLLPLETEVRWGLSLMLLSPGASFAVDFAIKEPYNLRFTTKMQFALMLSTILIVPLVLFVVFQIDPTEVKLIRMMLLYTFLLMVPIFVGWGLARWLPRTARPARFVLFAVSVTVLVELFYVRGGVEASAKAAVGQGTVLLLWCLVVASMVITWLVVRRYPKQALVVSSLSSMRNLGFVLLVTTSALPSTTARDAAIAYAAIMTVVNMVFWTYRERLYRPEVPEQAVPRRVERHRAP